MTIKSKLSTAQKLLQNVKVCPKISESISKRKVMPVSESMSVVEMEIGKFLSWIKAVKPICIQRNDAYRVLSGKAKHLAALKLPQCVFTVVFLDNVFYLVDGNTRKRSWLECAELEVPASVQVVIMVPDNLEHAKQLYACYDSNAAKKNNRDEMSSFLANAGIETKGLKSKLVAGGKYVTVAQAMARKYWLTNTFKHREAAIHAFAQELNLVDGLGLDEGTVPMGAVWAALSLYKLMPENKELISRYIGELKLLDTQYAHQVTADLQGIPALAKQACTDAQRGTSGTAACTLMYPVYLNGFKSFLRALSESKLYSPSHLNAMVRQLDSFMKREFV